MKNASDMLPKPNWSEFSGVVSGKPQTTGSVNIITRNRSEYLYIESMCIDMGLRSPLGNRVPEKLPFVFCIEDGSKKVGWTDRLDIAMEYVEFTDWITQNKVISGTSN